MDTDTAEVLVEALVNEAKGHAMFRERLRILEESRGLATVVTTPPPLIANLDALLVEVGQTIVELRVHANKRRNSDGVKGGLLYRAKKLETAKKNVELARGDR